MRYLRRQRRGSEGARPRRASRRYSAGRSTLPKPASIRRRFRTSYSNYVVANIFEAPLQYDYLARPALIKPRTAAAMPEISPDFKTIKVSIRPGIYFQDDPAFKGKQRELVAADYVYQLKRVADPRWKSPLWTAIESSKIVGLAERASGPRPPASSITTPKSKAFAFWTAIRSRSSSPSPAPRFYENLTDARIFGAVAREVVEAYPDEIMGKPVGTGPFRLAKWARSSKIVLERNPTFRDEFYDATPATDDVEGQAILARLKGRKLPLVDRVELSIIEENQPRWLSFLNGQQDIDQRSGRVHQHRGPQRKAVAGALETGHPAAADAQSGCRRHLLQHGRPGGGRIHAG